MKHKEEFKKICRNCNTEIFYSSKYTLNNSIKTDSVCKRCVCVLRNSTPNNSAKEKNSQWKGYKEIPYNWFSNYFIRAGKKRVGSITIEDVHALWVLQDKKCKLSNIDIGFYDDGKTHTCSIDRIDSLGEYTLNNIQLVHKDVNLMKNKFDQSYFLGICKAISGNI